MQRSAVLWRIALNANQWHVAMSAWARPLAIVILVTSVDGYAARHFLMGVSIKNWTSGEWTVFGIIVATLLFTASLVIFEIDKRCWEPRRKKNQREKTLSKAVDVRFLIPMLNQGRVISYATQDSEEHHTDEIVLRPHTETLVELWITSHTSFRTAHLTFGSYHYDNDSFARDRKPRPVRIMDTYGQFIIPKDCEPNVTPGHGINDRHQYRWNQDLRWTPHSTIIIGVLIKTFVEGIFRWQMYFAGDELDKPFELLIRVEKSHTRFLICSKEGHNLHRINIPDTSVIEPLQIL